MGEIADDMINGACCSMCGTYFDEDHGHPVLCKSCYKEQVSENLIGEGDPEYVPRATHLEL